MWSATRPPQRTSAVTRVAAAVIAAALLAILVAGTVLAAAPPPVQTYYIPFPEDQVLSALQTLYPSSAACNVPGAPLPTAAAPVTSYISISAYSAGTIIYYDHWEDGFEFDLSEPTQASTEIWGDGDPSNGAPPGIPSDILGGDAVIVLESMLNPAVPSVPPYPFDGGDKLGSTRIIAVTRAAWAAGTNTLLAGALEVYPVEKWGLRYEAPVGQDESLNLQVSGIFSYTALAIMATDDATTVAVDTDADGTVDVNEVIDEGESLYVPDVQIGGTVEAGAPVQVAMVTGETCAYYASRWYTLFPEELWSDSYYNPVSKMPEPSAVMTDTTVFLYNPDPSNAITVTYETSGGVQPAISVPAQSTSFVTMPVDSGAHFFTADNSAFQAIVAVDTFNDRNLDSDWGMSLVPEIQLTRQTLIGWGPGRDPTSGEKPDENGSPVWVMPVYANGTNGPVQICVDFDGDNAPGTEDGNGFYYDELLTLNEFESERVYDPDGDQTGMLLYVCDPATGQVPSAKLVAAWGQAPGDASVGSPGLDVGTAAPPAATFAVGKTDDLINDINGDGYAGPGDTLLYTVSIQNSSRVTVEQVILSDTVPLNTSYVLSTTAFDDGGGASPIPDDGSGTPFPLDEGGVLLGDLPVRGVFTVTFQVLIDDPYLDEERIVTNIVYVTAVGETATAEVQTPIFDARIELVKTPSDTWVLPGQVVTYTYTVTNPGLEVLSSVALTDDTCSPITPVGGDTGDDDILGIDETWTYTCAMPILDTTTNTATVTALDPRGSTVTDTDTALVDIGLIYIPRVVRQFLKPCPPPDGCPLEGRVKGLGVNPATSDIFVASRADGVTPDQLLKVDPYSVEIVDRAPTGAGSQPWGVVVNEQTNRVYVSNFGTGEVVVYDTQTLSETTRISLDYDPNDQMPVNAARMAILPQLDTVFVVVRRVDGDSRIGVINGLSDATYVSLDSCSGPWGIAADPVRNYVYVSCRNEPASFNLLYRDGGVWKSKRGPFFTEDKRQLFGLSYNPNSDPNQPGLLFSSYAIPGEFGDPDAWYVKAWEPDPNQIDWGQRDAREVPSGGDLNSPDVGGDGIVVNPATGHVFMANTGDDSITVLGDSGSAYLDQIPVRDDPFPAAVDPGMGSAYIGLREPGALIRLADTYAP